MNREDFQRVSEIRLRESRALLAAGFPEGAYYLAGYAVECALKACIGTQNEGACFSGKESGAAESHARSATATVTGEVEPRARNRSRDSDRDAIGFGQSLRKSPNNPLR